MRSKDITVGGVYAVEWGRCYTGSGKAYTAKARIVEKEIPQRTLGRMIGSRKEKTQKLGVRVEWLDDAASDRTHGRAPTKGEQIVVHVSKILREWSADDEARSDRRDETIARAAALRARLKALGVTTTTPGWKGRDAEITWRGASGDDPDAILVELPIAEVEKLLDALSVRHVGVWEKAEQ